MCTPVATGAGLCGTAGFDGVDGGPVPTTLVAVTAKVYDVPAFSVVTVHRCVAGPPALHVLVPGELVTV